MKSIFKVLLIVVILFLSTCMGFGVWFSRTFPSCDEDSDAVKYARSLTPERLAKLYYDMEKYSQEEEYKYRTFFMEDVDLPEEFKGLNVVKIRPSEGNIMVQGCFDHYIYLRFEGVGEFKEYDEHRRIILNWGEHPPQSGTQVLWSEI